MKTTLKAQKVSVQKENTLILKEVSLQMGSGEIVGLLGPSGAGKTTLMRVIMGLERPSGGSIQVFDQIPGNAHIRGKIGYVTQAPSVYGDLTVEENLEFFASILGVTKDEVQKTAEAVGLSSFLKRLTNSLSGGQRSRVSLAAALLGSPKFLVLDEPTVGLDPVLRQELWSLFRHFADQGCSLLVSSHVMDEAEHCDRLVLMREGAVIAEETPSELKRRTGTNTVEEAFLHIVTTTQ